MTEDIWYSTVSSVAFHLPVLECLLADVDVDDDVDHCDL